MLLSQLRKRFDAIFRTLVFGASIFGVPLGLYAERLPVRTYSIADGLLRDQASKIRQDSRGFLWFCTAEGVSRFDGYGFTNFTIADGLPDRRANDFLETRDGTIWIATSDGLARLNPTGVRHSVENPMFSVYRTDNDRSQNFQVLLEDSEGAILAGTRDGLYKLRQADGRTTLDQVSLSDSSDEKIHVTALLKDTAGILWVGTNGSGLVRLLPDDQIEQFTVAEGLPYNVVASLFEDASGNVWAGMRETGGLVRFVAERRAAGTTIIDRVYNAGDGLPSEWITALFQSRDGRFWIATTKGLCLWQGDGGDSICRTYTEQNGICDYDILDVFEDKDDNLWISSRCGITKIARYGFTTYTESDGLTSDSIHTVFENRRGELFAEARAKNGTLKISRFDGGTFETVTPNLPQSIKYFGWGWKQMGMQDSVGDWWFPTGEGLYRFSNLENFADLAVAEPEEMKINSLGKEIFRLYEDSRGDVWASITGELGSELFRWRRATRQWSDEGKKFNLHNKVFSTVFIEDLHGNLWIATGNDEGMHYIIRYRDETFKVFTKNEGAPPGWTRDVYLDQAGRLWFANTTWGLLRLDDASAERLDFVRYTIAEGMSSNAVYSVTEDELGRIYAGGARGFDRLTPTNGQIENFTTSDGLPNNHIEIGFRDRRNALWFATLRGLARFQPEPERQKKPPTIFLTGLRIGGVAHPVSILGETEIGGFDLDSTQSQISVDFVGLGATLGKKLRYYYRLTGEEWVETNERTVNFANLSPGSYLFEVRASTVDEVYGQPAFLRFHIAAPLWRRPWFIALAVIVAALAIYLVYRNRVTRLLELERTRTRIATDLHDDIGTNLSKISLLSDIVNMQLTRADEKNRQMLVSIAEISRESVSSMSDIVWAINPRRDSMSELISRMREYAEELLIEKGSRVVFEVPGDGDGIRLSMDTRRDLFLIFKEAVANAAKHSNCQMVEIGLHIRRGSVVLQVRDDGRGFDLSEEKDGNGLENMRRRAASHKGRFEVESTAGVGTKIIIHFPQR